jgi:hypothetical protein
VHLNVHANDFSAQFVQFHPLDLRVWIHRWFLPLFLLSLCLRGSVVHSVFVAGIGHGREHAVFGFLDHRIGQPFIPGTFNFGDDCAARALDRARPLWEIPIMAQFVTIAKHDKRKRLVLPDEFIAEAPYGEYIIREAKGKLSIVAIPAPASKRSYRATPALEQKLREAKDAKEHDCPPEFFTEPIED